MAKLWWRISGKRHQGALVAIYVGPDLLMLRSSYRRGWNFPGGGVQRNESPEQAARREIHEETGLLAAALIAKGAFEGYWESRQETVYFFELRLNEMPAIRIDNREIVESRLVAPQEAAKMRLTGPVAAFLRKERAEISPAFCQEKDGWRPAEKRLF